MAKFVSGTGVNYKPSVITADLAKAEKSAATGTKVGSVSIVSC